MAGPAANLAVGLGSPFEAQIDYLRQKLRLPSDRWDDIQRAAHDRAFIVAGAAKADLLKDLQESVTRAAEQGLGVAQFTREFRAVVARHGWTGWTGEGSTAGEAWRARTIYQTNMATSYAAGRYRQFTDPEYLAVRPFWRYIHSDHVMHPRPHHLAWHGLTLRHDHAFWQTHFAPNGWGCQCRITPVSAAEGDASARAGLGEPPEGWRELDPKTGAPVGIDKGFDYAPGARSDASLRQLVQEKLIKHPDAIASALSRDVGRYVNASADVEGFVRGVLSDRQRTDPLWLGFVEDPGRLNALVPVDVTGFTVLLPADAPRHVARSHQFDGGDQRPPTPEDFRRLADVLNSADELRLGDPVHRLVAIKLLGNETFRAVFEVLPGKKNRALALVSLVIKTR